MGILFSKGDYTTSRFSESNLKLEAQKVKEFSGDFNEWQKWKSRTECAFDGSGYEQILADKDYAIKHKKMNKIVYSQLSVATVEGNAHHLVKAHETSRMDMQLGKVCAIGTTETLYKVKQLIHYDQS